MSLRNDSYRWSLAKTAAYAANVGADGTQLHISQITEGKEDPVQIGELLDAYMLGKNIVHLGGFLSSKSFGQDGDKMLSAAIRMVKPYPNLDGAVCVIHNDSGSKEPPLQITEMAEKILSKYRIPIILGLECVVDLKNGPIEQQVDKYVELYGSLLLRNLPVIPVIDARNLHDMSQGQQLEDPENRNLEKLVNVSAGKKAIIHARDVKSIKDSYKTGNFVQIGTGEFASLYQKLSSMGKERDIDWQALVDENQEPVLQVKEDITETLRSLGLWHE